MYIIDIQLYCTVSIRRA